MDKPLWPSVVDPVQTDRKVRREIGEDHFNRAYVERDPSSREHREFYERFQSFWAAPEGARVAELIAPHAKIHFTGAETMSGASYVGWMTSLLAGMPDLVVTPVDYAGSGELIYIFWRAAATINGAYRHYYGIDRFRIENGMAVEEYVIFDSATLQGPVPNAEPDAASDPMGM